jgi:hypothetical protein
LSIVEHHESGSTWKRSWRLRDDAGYVSLVGVQAKLGVVNARGTKVYGASTSTGEFTVSEDGFWLHMEIPYTATIPKGTNYFSVELKFPSLNGELEEVIVLDPDSILEVSIPPSKVNDAP